MTYAPTEFEVTMSTGLGGDTFTKKNTKFAQYPLHHVTYSTTKFEVATSNGLEGETFTSKYII